MRLVLPYSLVTLILLATAWLTWPTHPADLFSCEIARLSGTEPEHDIRRCVQALNLGKSATAGDGVFVHRQVTLINADQPEPRFAQTAAEFQSKIDGRYTKYDRNVLAHTAALLGLMLIVAVAMAGLVRRKQKATPARAR